MIKCENGEIVYSIKQYYQTQHWKMLLQQYIDSELSNQCFKCKSNKVPVHFLHRTKKRIGHEKLTDLLPVCENCLNVCPERSKKKNERRQFSPLGFNPYKLSKSKASWILSIQPELRGYVLSKYFSQKTCGYHPSKKWINSQVKKTCKWIHQQEKKQKQSNGAKTKNAYS